MVRRYELQELLEELIGSSNVYFQPPATVRINYPCIIYSRDAEDTLFADDRPYVNLIGYKVMVIDSNPDSEIPGKVAALPMCAFRTHYTKDNLNYDIYKLYF